MRNTILLGAAVLTIFVASMGGSVALAQHSGHGGQAPPTAPTQVIQTGKVKGTIVEVGPTSITVETQKSGRTERLTCLMDGRTKTKGDLRAGADVVLKYREEYGVRTATSIEVKKTKQPGS